MEHSTKSISPYNEYEFINLCSTGQIDTLCSMLEAEKKYQFSIEDVKQYRQALIDAAKKDVKAGGTERTTTPISSNTSNVDWRYRISRWMLRAADEFSISRETACIALSYCDRYLMGKRINRHLFQTLAIASFFYASKVYEKRKLTMDTILHYTQGKFQRGHLLSMENELMASLSKHTYPPLASTFCLIFLSGLPSVVSTSEFLVTIMNTCQFMIELASCDYFFVAHKQSKIALASIVVAISEQSQIDTSEASLQTWLNSIKLLAGVNDGDTELTACVEHLRTIFKHNSDLTRLFDDGKKNDGYCTTTGDADNRKQVFRAATPSPREDEIPAPNKKVVSNTTTKFTQSTIVDENQENRNPNNPHISKPPIKKRRVYEI